VIFLPRALAHSSSFGEYWPRLVVIYIGELLYDVAQC